MDSLTVKQQRFCEEYMIDLNATNAYIRAGYSADGASQNSSRMMATDKVKIFIDGLKDQIRVDTNITISKTVLLIKDIVDSARGMDKHSEALKGVDMLMKYLGGYEKDKASNSVIELTVKDADKCYLPMKNKDN